MITPNQLTLFRVVIAFVSPVLLLLNRSLSCDLWVVFLFTIACITDWWDGYLARKQSMITGTGKIMDPIADKILILGLMTVFVKLGLYSFGWIFFILIREVSVTAIRLIRFRKGKAIPAEWAGKMKLGFQIASVYLTFFLLIFYDAHNGQDLSDSVMYFNLFHYLGIVLANIFTVLSGFLFFKRLNQQ